MTAMVRFDLTMDAAEKDVLSRAAALMGTTMAAFVRSAAKEKAKELLDRESRITMTVQDFDAFTRAQWSVSAQCSAAKSHECGAHHPPCLRSSS